MPFYFVCDDVLLFDLSVTNCGWFQPVTLELGGKSPLLVFEDVDLDKGKDVLTNFMQNFLVHTDYATARSITVILKQNVGKLIMLLPSFTNNSPLSYL